MGALWRIILPLSKIYTVQLGLAIFRDRYSTECGNLMAGSVVGTLPIPYVMLNLVQHRMVRMAIKSKLAH